MHSFKCAVMFALSALVLGGAVFAGEAQQGTQTRSAAAKLSDADRTFVQKVIDGAAKELQISQVAARKAQSKAVREFATSVVHDHEKSNPRLMELHDKLLVSGGPPQKKSDRDVKQDVEELNAADGAEFDRQYMELMVQDHEEAVKLFERQAQHGKDPQLKSTAQDILPGVQRHLAMAREVTAGLQK